MHSITAMIKPVSSACNMRCRYCFYADVASRREHASMGKMSDETLENLVRKALRYADTSATFAFQGGEPTLAGVDFFRKLIEYQKQYNSHGVMIQNAIQTNACSLDNELLDFLAQEHFLVGVSFDGTPEIHDKMRLGASGEPTSAAVENTIKKLQERKIDFNILCVVNKYVAQHPVECFHYLKRYRFIQYIACLDNFDSSPSEHSLTVEDYTAFLKKTFNLYYEEYKKGKFVSIRNFDNYLGILAGYEPENCAMCGRCAQYFLVEADGGVYPCDFYVLDRWYMGNINDSSFFKLRQSPVAAEFAKASLQTDPSCRDCKWYVLCRGGCRRDREPVVNNVPALNKWCSCYKELFDYAFPRMQEMAKKMIT